ncbi:MAG TPA: magnesium transporter CorA family protein [Candidatus Polarisedimenticolaceae bacterium]|nr:magnesium transporter CorA family protein [Candidatus Polarisedimenticolaceae bacterium]
MIHAYVAGPAAVERREVAAGEALPDGAVWLDLLEPTEAERALVERAVEVEFPTRAEMVEIEPSSRLYTDRGAIFMTATIISHADRPNPGSDVITFILARGMLVTLRYVHPKPVATFAVRLERQPALCATSEAAFLGLIDSFVDRIADILERVGVDLDNLSQQIFRDPAADGGDKPDLHAMLRTLGRNDDLTSTAAESLLSLSRLLRFFQQATDGTARKEQKARIKDMQNDLLWLRQHVDSEASKVGFLLDATLGLINIEQNAIIKIFSVAAVVFLPPTLVASIYGMNFRWMPELESPFGYPGALILMVLSAVLPYAFFKRKGWL